MSAGSGIRWPDEVIEGTCIQFSREMPIIATTDGPILIMICQELCRNSSADMLGGGDA